MVINFFGGYRVVDEMGRDMDSNSPPNCYYDNQHQLFMPAGLVTSPAFVSYVSAIAYVQDEAGSPWSKRSPEQPSLDVASSQPVTITPQTL